MGELPSTCCGADAEGNSCLGGSLGRLRRSKLVASRGFPPDFGGVLLVLEETLFIASPELAELVFRIFCIRNKLNQQCSCQKLACRSE